MRKTIVASLAFISFAVAGSAQAQVQQFGPWKLAANGEACLARYDSGSQRFEIMASTPTDGLISLTSDQTRGTADGTTQTMDMLWTFGTGQEMDLAVSTTASNDGLVFQTPMESGVKLLRYGPRVRLSRQGGATVFDLDLPDDGQTGQLFDAFDSCRAALDED
ncbi:hypothetical protein [Stakelama tenebrarum]|uniref:Invasion associated locus B family protein n=1 Tax=Stakelama tenebrarum TaxID=2711215 RepID=A0A6G6Y848_9SPHN|nr:hypothetical protein [Sphingosinithalassobacter tenebrarum]QIG81089.1 hypothetical protein G5C33_15725 [Sphingosinithalassobacter tenebrarum]